MYAMRKTAKGSTQPRFGPRQHRLSATLLALVMFLGTVSTGLATASAATPECENGAASDPDGDGWGWENGASCRVVEDIPASPTTSGTSWCPTDFANRVDFDADGDGWGWDEGQSCKVQFPRIVDAALARKVENTISNASEGRALTAAQKRTFAEHVVAAFGNRPDLIDLWDDNAGRVSWADRGTLGTVTVQGSEEEIAGWNRCNFRFKGWYDWEYRWRYVKGEMVLTHMDNERIVVHEFAHAVDCRDRVGGTGDGFGTFMNSNDVATIRAERERIFQAFEDNNTIIAGLREYSFQNEREFWATSAEVFLGRNNELRISMAEDAPALYDALRNYYQMNQWPAAADVERPQPPRIDIPSIFHLERDDWTGDWVAKSRGEY